MSCSISSVGAASYPAPLPSASPRPVAAPAPAPVVLPASSGLDVLA
jgi:hypothetical protein